MTFVLSAHLDDGVLGLGQYLSAEPAHVVTVFAGIPEVGTVTAYDEKCGFASSVAAMEQRRREDRWALDGLECSWTHLDLLDHQYGHPHTDEEVAAAIAPYVGLADVHTFAPLGLDHPDHRQLARVARSLVPAGGELLIVEELPARVLHPEEAARVLAEVWAAGFNMDPLPHPLPVGDLGEKRFALGEYRSQWPDGADDPCFYVPERVWRATRPEPESENGCD